MGEFDKVAERYQNEKDPAEKAHLRRELDQMPLSSGELEQVQQREANRQQADIAAFHKERGN